MSKPSFTPGKKQSRKAHRRPETGAAMLELAFSFPLLIVLAVGAWDFGMAFARKDTMTNGAREAARISISVRAIPPLGSSAPCASSSKGPPCVIVSAVSALQRYMINAGVDLSCIDPNSPSSAGPDLEEYTYTCSGIPDLTIVIDRSAFVTGSSGLPIQETRVTFTDPIAPPLAGLFPEFPKKLQTVVMMTNLVN